MPTIAFFGDTHGAIDLMVEEALRLDADMIVQVGDFGTYVEHSRLDHASKRHGSIGDFHRYYSGEKTFPIPVHFIKGNHEDFEVIEEIKDGKVKNLFYLENGGLYAIGGLRVAALGGNYSPARYNLPRGHPRLKAGKRKHFTVQDIDDIRNARDVDMIVAHEGPSDTGLTTKCGKPVGIKEIRELIEDVQPDHFIHGHYHHPHGSKIGKTEVICLDRVRRKYQPGSVLLLV